MAVSKQWTYDVYLSFGEEETRRTFVDHLYTALSDSGIRTYKALQQVQPIGPEVFSAIEQSRYAIVVFSKFYASSTWCLDEFAHIMECRRDKSLTVLPIFYSVDPDFRKHIREVAEKFATLHESDRVRVWTTALVEAVGLPGWELKISRGRHEAKLINEIVERISLELQHISFGEDDSLVKTKSQVPDMVSYTGIRSYDVFVSFRGEDTRRTFIDHLYASLDCRAIITYKDNSILQAGKSIIPDLLQAIDESRIAIVVFSKNYASSKWCLDELTHIMECFHNKSLIVLPVFYDVEPSDVRKQTGSFGENFAIHETEWVRVWRDALYEASNLSGWELSNKITNGHEAQIIKEIITRVSLELRNPYLARDGSLVAMKSQASDMKSSIKIGKESTASSSLSKWTHDVFLSFRGEDTRRTFVDHLYTAFEYKRFCAYYDDVKLLQGDSVPHELLQAIDKSRVAIVVFSKNYSSSSWCLDELTYIMKCFGYKSLIVLPVFYNVDPSDVRKQTGHFGEQFAKHKSGKVDMWSDALFKASNLSGWEIRYGDEANGVKDIVQQISNKIALDTLLQYQNPVGKEHDKSGIITSSVDHLHLIGIARRVQELAELLGKKESCDVFLNFASVDTVNTISVPLRTALSKKGLTIVNDDDVRYFSETPLATRVTLWQTAWKLIERSSCAIVVFSKMYCRYPWCLHDLVKIMECNKTFGLIVLPVFDYDFDTSDLLEQVKVLAELLKKDGFQSLQAWPLALLEAANLPGINLKAYRNEASCINEIIELVLYKIALKKLTYHQNVDGMDRDELRTIMSSGEHEDLVGIERRVLEVKPLLAVKKAEISSKSTRQTYDVLISYKDNDTCRDFADQLYFALDREGIYTLRDNQNTSWNQPVSSEVMGAFVESYIALVIFSKNYAASSQCLDKLLNIMSCNESFGQNLYPVFYDVDPSDVRNQKGVFGELFMQHRTEKVTEWRKVLAQAGSLRGWYMNYTPKSHEAAIIRSIVDTISNRLVWPAFIDKNLIGIMPRMKDVESLLKLGSGGVRMVGIWGMGGSGKTTIARAVFDKISKYFDGSCFAEDIRGVSLKYGLNLVQKQILSDVLGIENLDVSDVDEGASLLKNLLRYRKVLIVLDNVDHWSQIEFLAGSSSWFGEGSRIIISTRDEYVLVSHNVRDIYQVNLLNGDDSIQFLKRFTVAEDAFTKDYEDLLLQCVRYAAGLPLALKVLSSSLRGKTKEEWRSTLIRSKAFPEKKIYDTLKISFDGLNDDLKNIFIDVACFFNGVDKERVSRILHSCWLAADSGIRLLEQKSLIRISKKRVYMHDVLRDMGRYIASQKHSDEPQLHRRLWDAEEVSDMLLEGKAAEGIVAIVVDDFPNLEGVDLGEAFKGLKNLKLLQIFRHNKSRPLQGRIYLPEELRWVTWENYPLQCLPGDFELNKLSGLELRGSCITELWKDIKYLPNLRFLDLGHSKKLICTPDFTGTPKIERLVLENCSNLVKINKSIGSLKRLSFLNLSSCKRLGRLPRSVLELESLEFLYLNGCSNLKSWSLVSNLVKVHRDRHMIKAPPSPIGYMHNLVSLEVQGCSNLLILPDDLPNLRNLNAQGCSNLTRLPDNLPYLAYLNVQGCSNLTRLPDNLPNLRHLDAQGCSSDLMKLLVETSHTNQKSIDLYE